MFYPAVIFCLVFLCCQLTSCLAGRGDIPAWYPEEIKCNRSVDVAIIGAGPAGTYSAYRMRDTNKTIEVFEYSNRIGGRILTVSLGTMPDMKIELGAMRFIDGKHHLLQKLVRKFNLTQSILEGFGEPEKIKYFLRGKRLTLEDIKFGDVPYDLSPVEKANQENLTHYYLRELTGFNESILRDDQLMKLRVKDGRRLYKLRINEALDMVATAEGKAFVRALASYDCLFAEDVSAVDFFNSELGEYKLRGKVLTIKGGMIKLPESMVWEFLEASDKNKLSLNKKLERIDLTESGSYRLEFLETITSNGSTVKTSNRERVCANKVILAIPQRALIDIDWKPLRQGKVNKALNAVMPIPASKIYLTFPKAWWLTDDTRNSSYIVKSDAPLSQMYSWRSSNVSREHVLIASYADMYKTSFLERLNSEGAPISESASGTNRVTKALKQELITHLSEVFGVDEKDIPEPIRGVSKFWSQYPFGGAWTVWKAGYHNDDIRQTIQHPSLTDDVFIVGSDYALSFANGWVEASLSTVDEVIDKYL